MVGEVNVAGRDLIHTPLAKLAGEIALVFANPFNQITGARFTVREELAFGLENMGCAREEMLPRIEEVLRPDRVGGRGRALPRTPSPAASSSGLPLHP